MRRILFGIFIFIALSSLVLGCSAYKKPEQNLNPPAETVDPAPQNTAANEFKRGSNIPGKLYWIGRASDKKIALTFDDGPEEKWTPQILDILKQKSVKATFFVIGSQAKKYPAMLQRINNEGHIIGNHTYNHVDLTKLPIQQAASEIDECENAIKAITGKSPSLIRPPFGFHSADVDNVIYGKNYYIILWSTDTEDWRGFTSQVIQDRVIPHIKNGGIILQHDGENPHLGGSVEALPILIDKLRDSGYSFVTIPELLDLQAYH